MGRIRATGGFWRRRARRQGGFTLIEMLVVVSILGILAMIATISVFGITSLAQQRAKDAELMTIRSAMAWMITDQQVDPGDVCTTSPPATMDMERFPVAPANPRDPDEAPPKGEPAPLYPRYLHGRWMSRSYVCTVGGTVDPAGT